MNIQSALILLFLTILPFLCWMLVPLIWRYRQTAGALPLAGLLFAVGWWGLAYAIELWAGVNLTLKIFWSAVKYGGIVFIPVFWLIFALEYTRSSRLAERSRRLLSIVPVLSLLVLATNSWHGLFRSNLRVVESPLLVTFAADFEPWFWVHTVYSYILLVAGAVILLRGLPTLPVIYRRQRVAVFVAILLPFIANILSLFSFVPIPNFDLTPMAFAVTVAVLAWAFTGLKLLDITPVARQQIVDQSPVGIIVIDAEQRVIDVNRMVKTLLNVEGSNLIGQSFYDSFPLLAEALPTFNFLQTHFETELTIPHDIDTRYCLVQVDVLEGEGGQISGHIITLLDITSRKAIEQTLAQKEAEAQKLAHVASRTINMVVITDAHGQIEWVNDSFVSITGYTADEVMGKKPGHLLQGEETDPETVQYIRECLAKGEGFSCELINYSKEGHAYWVYIEAQAVHDDAGQLKNFIAIETDISERKALEASLRQREAEALYSAYKQATIYELLRIISTELETSNVLSRAVQIIVEQTGWASAAIFFGGTGSTTLKLEAAYPKTDASASQVGFPYVQLYRLGLQAYQAEKTVTRPVLSADDDMNTSIELMTGQLAVPLRWGIKVTGVLVAEKGVGKPFTADEVALAEAFADTLVIGLNNARLYEELDKYLLELSMMHSISQAATLSLDVEAVLRETLLVTISSSEFDGGAIVLTERDSKRLMVAVTQDPAGRLTPILESRTFLRGLKDKLIQEETSLWSKADSGERSTDGELSLYWQKAHLEQVLTIPLIQQKNLLGGLILFCTQPPKKEIPTSMFLTAAPQIATAIASTSFHQEISQKHSQLNTLIEATQDGIVLIDTNNTIQILNEAAHSLLDLYDRPQEWQNRPMLELQNALFAINPIAYQEFLDAVNEPLPLQQRVRQGEAHITDRFISWTEVLVIDEAETVLGRLFVLHDVTEEKQLLQMRDDLTNTIVHDMRNPLMGIKAALEMLEFQLADADDDLKELFELAQESSDNLVLLVSSLLDISRLESGRMPLNKQETPISHVAEQIVTLETPLAAQKQIALDLDMPADLPHVYADRNLLLRVFQNLVGNAIKFTPEHGQITIHAAVQADDQLRVCVRDTGAGIPHNVQESLFQKFTTGKHQNSGSGLGLAFCRLVVEAHGGKIWVESEPGHGSAFKFTLPPESEFMPAAPSF